MTVIRLLPTVGLLLALSACTTNPTNALAAPDQTLYQRLGGQQGVTLIVDNLLYEIGADDHIIDFFAKTDIDRFRGKLIEQLCQVSDGPCDYSGDGMAEVHKGMDLDNSHFDALVSDLIAAMDDAEVPVGAQNDLLARLVPLHDEVIGGGEAPAQ